MFDLKERILADKCMSWEEIRNSCEWQEFLAAVKEGSLKAASCALSLTVENHAERLDVRTKALLSRVAASLNR